MLFSSGSALNLKFLQMLLIDFRDFDKVIISVKKPDFFRHYGPCRKIKQIFDCLRHRMRSSFLQKCCYSKVNKTRKLDEIILL
jgi:hypothetical protein